MKYLLTTVKYIYIICQSFVDSSFPYISAWSTSVMRFDWYFAVIEFARLEKSMVEGRLMSESYTISFVSLIDQLC